MTSQTLNQACERMSLAELADVVRLHCAITEAEACGNDNYAEGLRDVLRSMVTNNAMTRFFPAPGEQSPTTAQKPPC